MGVRTVESKYTWLALTPRSHEPGGEAVYARTTIASETERDAVLRLAVDDWAFVWLNGEKITTLKHEHGLETVRIPVKLKKGANELRIKTNNTIRPNRWLWAISCVVEK